MDDQKLWWRLEWDDDHERLLLDIEGYFDEKEGVRGAERLRELGSQGPFELVADLSLMTGYDRATREAWQSTFIDLRRSIKAVHFVGLGPVFRMAAATVCLAARIPAYFYESADAIPRAGGPTVGRRS